MLTSDRTTARTPSLRQFDDLSVPRRPAAREMALDGLLSILTFRASVCKHTLKIKSIAALIGGKLHSAL